MTAFALTTTSNAGFLPIDPSPSVKTRLATYVAWLDQTARSWWQPDLATYRDHLLHHHTSPHRPKRKPGLSPSTVKTHLVAIRSRYNQLLRSNQVRQLLHDLAPATASPADRKALVDEVLVQMQNAVHPTTATVQTVTVQDHSDGDHLRLTAGQVEDLVRAPGLDTIQGLRDTAIMALLATTGVREAELIDLDCDDLRQTYDGVPALRVRDGKGGKQRLVPYGDGVWSLVYVDAWLDAAGIVDGAVFRGLYKGGKVRPGRLTTRSVNRLFQTYQIAVNGLPRTVQPHDLRRTYAKLNYDAGMPMTYLASNLGHASIETTASYVGRGDGRQRQPGSVLRMPHRASQLTRL